MDDNDFHEILLDEICWSFEDKKYSSLEDFYGALQEYQYEITGAWLNEESTYGLDINKARIEFDFVVESSSGWTKKKRSIEVESRSGEFSEVELLYEIHNSIQYLFKDYDHKYLEGLELMGTGEVMVYELILGS